MIAASANVADCPTASKVRAVVARSFWRPGTQWLADEVRNAFVNVAIKSPGGVYVGRGVGLRVNIPRLQAVVRQTIRGLFFIEAGMPLPRDCVVRVHLEQFGHRIPAATRQLFGERPQDHIHQIGDVFEYAVFPQPNEPTSLWVGTFYRRVWFLAYVQQAVAEGVGAPSHRRPRSWLQR
ncbi:MAG: hypothetical protein WBO45_18185 [Planctomycetota bacterium]